MEDHNILINAGLLLLSVLLIAVPVNIEATRSLCFDKSRNETFKCVNGYCDSSANNPCTCYSGYYGRTCDRTTKSILSEVLVGVIILIPAMIWIILRVYNRKHRISRNSRIRKRPRRSTSRSVEEGDNDGDSPEIDDSPPNYSEAMSPSASSPDPLFIISSNPPNPFKLPSYEEVLKEKESQETTVGERNNTYPMHDSTWSQEAL